MPITRPFKAVRAINIVVAPVLRFAVDLATLGDKIEVIAANAQKRPMTLDRLRRYLQGIRDGGEASDSFYLGSLDPANVERRYAASLETLHTVVLHDDKRPERQQWVKDHRVARLSEEYLRDLHVRMHLTFGRLGFDDYDWYTDADLAAMVRIGTMQLNAAETDVLNAEQDLAALEASAVSGKEKELEGRRRKVEDRKEEVEKVRGELEPYLTEQASRKQVPDA